MVCHPKCRDCGGPGPEDCRSCFAPLVLYAGRCLYTSCQAASTYFDPDSEQCLPCDATCAECEAAGAAGCTTCPPLRYLLTASELDVAGQCLAACPLGHAVEPASQRCRRAPPGLAAELFYLKATLRMSVDEFLENPDLLRSILLVAAEILAVSPQDVRFFRWEPTSLGLGILYYLQVENPFLRRRDVRAQLDIDRWFAALPVPVDDVEVLSRSQIDPPPVMPKPEPLLSPWIWALIGAGAGCLLILYPLYHFYFVRKHFEKTPYRPNTKREAQFVQHVLDHAPEKAIVTLAEQANEARAAQR